MNSLAKLEWLNMSGNPMVQPLAKLVSDGGDVWTDVKCSMAAANVVHFMGQVKKFADNVLVQQRLCKLSFQVQV